ncbi:CsbD family protein [Rhodocaloribacter litoris]|uniref:CsbD family protein n=1 Tax=Rhodocaloribacter litoris TaxID=2558931 RepID=UPI001421EB0E|nr:CsbD family protein [Rhodocaloribacter litoris]
MENPKMQALKGNWKQFVGKIKETWGDLTDDDLDRFEGRMDQLEGYIQEKTGEERSEIRRRIDQIAEELKRRV